MTSASRAGWLPERVEMAPLRVRGARLLVLALLLVNVPSALVLTARQTVWDPTPGAGWTATLLVAYSAAQAAALHAAVTPWVSARRRDLAGAALSLSTVLLAWPLGVSAATGTVPWAWAAGFALGALALLYPSGWRVALGPVAAVAGGTISVALGSPVRDLVVFMLVTGAGAIASGAVVVWLLRLLIRSESAREAEVSLAVTQERLRVARDLHDLLVQSLTVIALKAELAEQQASEPDTSVQQARDIRTLAADTLVRTRLALRGFDTLDLAEQLRTAGLVLSCAGVAHDLSLPPGTLPPGEISHYFAAVVREGLTNVLRHSDATACTITVTQTETDYRLRIVNDQPRPGDPSMGGMGLRGLRERGQAVNAALTAGPQADLFVLEAVVGRPLP